MANGAADCTSICWVAFPASTKLNNITRDHSTEKKANLVNRLLSDEYVEEYAQNWSNLWTTILIGRPPAGNDKGSLVDRDGMQKYLRDSFARNKPYDQMVRELVTAERRQQTGRRRVSRRDEFSDRQHGPDKKTGEKWINATAKTAKVFLGLQVQCTQCHNHPFNDWKQNQFWELNAFFRQTDVRDEGPRKTREPLAELVSHDFAGEAGRQRHESSGGVVFYELRNGQLKSAFPVFVDGTANQSQRPAVGRESPRRIGEVHYRLANYLDQAIVNRMWGHFLGYGFTKPIDDMGPHNPPSHPELLTKLAD